MSPLRGSLHGALILLLLIGLSAEASQQQNRQTETSLALVNATLIDGTGAPPHPEMAILIRGDSVVQIESAETFEIPPGTRVIDLAGKFVIPGLIEGHTHIAQLVIQHSRERMHAELERMLYGGIIVAREMAGDLRITAEASRAARLGQIPSPDIYFAAVIGGPHFVGNDRRVIASTAGTDGDAPWAQSITSESDLRLSVARAAGTGATALKLYLGVDADLIEALTAEAHRQGLAVWAHSTVYPERPLAVVRAGVDSISHACGLVWQDPDVDPAPFEKADVSNRPRFDDGLIDPDGDEMRALFAEMVRRGTILDPTLANHLRPGDDRFGCTSDLMVALTRAAHRAGVRLVAGTDFHAPADDPWPSLHGDIEALVERGVLTPLEAITAATLHGAMAAGIEETHGTIEPGKLANLVVLTGDPVRDIRAIRSVETVIKRGKLYHRQDYETRRASGTGSSVPD